MAARLTINGEEYVFDCTPDELAEALREIVGEIRGEALTWRPKPWAPGTNVLEPGEPS